MLLILTAENLIHDDDLVCFMQLKNSAGSPSRVTTTGNEIEIELSADAVTEGGSIDSQVAVPHGDEYSEIHQQAAVLQQPAVLRSGGVMCRGGGVSGPRFRMPVSQPPRMSSGLLVRHPTQQVVIAPQLQQQVVPGPQPVVGGSFSCPFCSLTFIDSPALYEHLSILHTVDQKTKWKQPKGREGKTIVPVKRSGRSPDMASQRSELGPPVLTPVETFNRSGGGDAHIDGDTSQQSHTDKSIPQETGLFEDPVEPEVTKKPRGRPPKHSIEGATPAKRQKVMEQDDGDDDGDNEDDDEFVSVPKSKHRASSGDTNADEKQGVTSGGRRGGRTPRGRRRS